MDNKLPTTKELIDENLGGGGLELIMDDEMWNFYSDVIRQCIESHTAAHTAALRERVKELEDASESMSVRLADYQYEELAGKLHGHIRGNDGEYILCAAIWYKDIPSDKPERTAKNIDKGIVITGYRHGHCIAVLNQLGKLRSVLNGPDSVGDYIQGFLTSKGRFVDRKEAGSIAFDRGQIKKGTDCLFSEDLY